MLIDVIKSLQKYTVHFVLHVQIHPHDTQCMSDEAYLRFSIKSNAPTINSFGLIERSSLLTVGDE